MANLSKRAQAAVKILEAGGYFRKALETQYKGGEKFIVRLRHSDGSVAAGFSFQTFFEILDAGLLSSRACAKSSAWPEEFELKK